MNTNWNFPTTIWFGAGRIIDLPLSCQKSGIKKPLLVTDNGLVKLDVFEEVKRILREANIDFTTYSSVQGNPTEANVLKGVLHYNKNRHDGVIAFGGGSALDAAKAIAFMSGQSRSLWDFEDVGDNWARAEIDGIAPIIAIPTTAGTGSEVGRASVILDKRSQTKKIIFHPKMLPGTVIVDPELTLGLPPHITAWTGVDAMVHAIEAYIAPGYHPMAEGIAIEAIRIISKYLPKAFNNGTDVQARGQMLVAASMGATAFQKGLGSVHSIAHQLGAIYNKEHGLLNAILLPYALKQNQSAIEEKMVYLSKVLELKKQGTDAIIEYILQLRKELNIPHTLKEIGINDDEAERIGKMAFKDPSTPSNAKPLNEDDLEKLFKAAVNGELNIL
ncbi:iron-containing alcohol dehydrogenase [Pricia sp. S334]|uniref:Iron-containing alcohol dehydrogenase n=1 Tax=Pricia mediterranea TaxID=3076079 RepID=A0ABU3L3K3_9FLAO|nr:iron-containing alcohol dehydrogenase [Pricia sp. S334]MDT7828325.1 iron-containing alcohol dehydrogenase [Pricia sp. S334]